MTNYDILQEYEAQNAPVPSYEEWQELQEYKRIVTSYNMKPIDYDIACKTVNKLLDEKEKLRNELGLLKESIGKDCGTHYANLFLQENQQLKDVISKMCMELVDPDDGMSNGLAEYFNQDLLLEINEVLK